MTEHLESRVSILETAVSALTKDLRGLANLVKENNRALSSVITQVNKDLSTDLKIISDKITEQSKTNWGNVISFIGLCILILGACFSPVWISISDINNDVEKNSSTIKSILQYQRDQAYKSGVRDGLIGAETKNN